MQFGKTVASNFDASLGVYQWTVPDVVSSNCKIKLASSNNESVADESDNTFSIQLPKNLENLFTEC